MTPARHCRQVVWRAGSSFSLPLWLIPAPRRRAMFALYAFCRQVDDVADRTIDRRQAAQRLEEWLRELEAAFAGRPGHPITRELVWAVERFHLPTEPFFHILEGMGMDLTNRPYSTWEELEVYCQRVAVTVGRETVAILDRLDPTGEALAHHLGIALQLTNILRDVAKDAHLGRVYLPRQLLGRHGLTADQVLNQRFSPPLAAALAELAQRAESHYRRADALVQGPRRRLLRPILLMAAIYHAYLERLEAVGYDVFTRPIHLSTGRRLTLVATTWWRERPPRTVTP